MKKFKTRLISVMLTIAMAFSLAPAGITISYAGGFYKEEGEEADFSYGVLGDDTVEIIKYKGSSTEVIIPDTLGGKSVTSIGLEAFSGCSSLTSITIPASVTSIKSYAFLGCSSLTSIEIPANVTSIGEHAFEGCSSLTSIEIPASVMSIGEWAFKDCSSLVSINIPASVTRIGAGAFSECSKLTSIEIPANVTSIGDSAFYGCNSLISINIPASVTSIGEWAFENCSSLASIEIPADVTSIGDGAFSSCSSLTSIEIPAGATSIGGRTFSDCSKLTSIEIPDSVTSIGDDAFSGCDKLTIYGNSGSYAETYAKENDISFTALDMHKLADEHVILKSATVTYTGKAIKVAVTVKDGSKTLKSGTDYTVAYKNNKNVGTATVTIKGKGSYTGTVTKTFDINPKKQTVKLKALKKGFKVSYTKATKAEATGYEIKYATSKSALKKAKAVTVKSIKTASKSISKLKAGKKYFVQVRTYKKVGKDTYYGTWSAAVSVKTKK